MIINNRNFIFWISNTFIDYWTAGKYYRLLFLPKEKLKQHERTKWHIQFKKAVA